MPMSEFDVVIVGAGAAGLTAAVIAHDRGASVVVLEKSDKVGGAMSVSAGDIWIPCNPFMEQMGVKDSKEEAVSYLRRVGQGIMDEELISTYVENAPKVLKYLLEKTPVRVEPRPFPDYHAELPGGKKGRTVGTALFDAKQLGEWAEKVRMGYFPPVSFAEITRSAKKLGGIARADKLDLELIASRLSENIRGLGSALACMLLKACLDRGIPVHLSTPVYALIKDEKGRVVGVKARKGDGETVIKCRKAVILATGGFDWNQEYIRLFTRMPGLVALSPPSIEGDGLRMGAAAGAALLFKGDGLLAPSIKIPDEEFEGRPLYRFEAFNRMQPSAIVVNRYGERFINEAVNYHDFVRGVYRVDPVKCEFTNVPCWMIFDQKYYSRYIIGGAVTPDQPIPEWMIRDDTIEGLARKLNIDSERLKLTISRFNSYAEEGVDRDFQRGTYPYDIEWSDPDHQPNPSLGTIDTPPFYAVELVPAVFGTAGGLKINSKAQVLDWEGRPIEGLYACGNAAAFTFAPVYPASGSGLGNAIVFGYIAGLNASA